MKTEGAEKKGAYPLENPSTMCSYLFNVTFSFHLDPMLLPKLSSQSTVIQRHIHFRNKLVK